ncbi:MAG TPA: hypothetical protein ENN41_04125 [Sediminispirochaeta sp.]|nr:hypothetical protein [Sediminispirochaeta sp.]
MYTHFNHSYEKTVITLHPGEYYVSSEDIYIATVLGSCVAVVLYDSQKKIAGMNHYMLPGDRQDDAEKSARYGINAMELLINGMMKAGADRRRLRAKVFGGGNVLDTESNVGFNNVRFATTFLQEEMIPIDGRDTEGVTARKIFCHPPSGQVYLKRLHQEILNQVRKRESHHLENIRKKDFYGGFTLFEK